MPKNINEFFKGDNRDIDVLKITNDTARRIQNMRVLDVDGKGLVLTNIGGNEIKFNITNGFIPLGGCEYNGVAYIASVNMQTGQGELGCYPAPNSLVNQDCNLTGWGPVKQYAPFFNFTGPNLPRNDTSLSQPFRTNLFNFDCFYQVDMFAREDYDGSVSLYIASGNNPIRVFNTGFDQEGNCVSIARRYWDNSFPNAVNLLHESNNHADVQFLGLGPAGSNRSGNWMYFFRYSTENFDKTSFFTETNAIQITNGTYAAEGIRHHGAVGGVKTDKSVNLRISNLDPTYSYLEVGYIYNFGDDQEFGIIDKLYPIDSTLTTLDIEITGFEGFFEVGVEEILRTKPNYDGAWTHTQLENRYFAGNLFDTTEFGNEGIEAILEFSRSITCRFDDSKEIPHTSGGAPLGIYNNEINVYNSTGYFRGEPYAYAIIGVLTNGRETQAFPVTGSDDYSGLGGTPNDNGIYRFPNVNVSPTVTANNIRVMGVKFDISTAIANMPQYILDNISGFYFVRAQRNETLIYQGVSIPCYNAAEGTDPRPVPLFAFNDFPKILKRNENVIPMFEIEDDSQGAKFPYIVRFDFDDLNNNEFTFATQWKKFTEKIFGKWGFYSPDHFFNKSLGIKKGMIKPFATVAFGIFTDISPSKDDYYYRDNSYSFANEPALLFDIFNIKEWEQSNNNGYASYFNEGAKSDYNSMFYFFEKNLTGTKYVEVRSMAAAWNAYIGIDTPRDMRYKLSNIYKGSIDPAGLDPVDLYDIKATKYYKISKFYKLSDLIANPGLVNNTVYYKGDCFLQRTWLKQMYNPKYGVGVKDDGGGGILGAGFPSSFLDDVIGERLFTFGVVFSIITENKINTEMRYGDFINKTFPADYGDVYDFAVKDIEKESELLNRGYNVVLSQKFYLGIDEEIPFFPDNKPVGIEFSQRHAPGSPQDGYRIVDLAALREYDYRLGPIKSLQVLNNLLISVQKNGINRHFVNEKAVLNQGNSAGELLLGTGDILDAKHMNLADYVGTQHQWSIVSTDRAIYGVDFNKRKGWRMTPDLRVEILSDTKGYRELFHELCEMNTADSDITEFLPDNPICNAGIVAAYDRKHNDVYFTWVYGNPEILEDKSLKNNARTIVFNEWMDAYHGERIFSGIGGTPIYLSINEDFFTFNPRIFPSINPNPTGLGDAWIQDIKQLISGADNSTTFFGEVDEDISFVEFIVNEPADLPKVFDNLAISSHSEFIYRITYQTEFQESEYFPFFVGTEDSYWRDPKYKENFWRLPIIRTQTEIAEPNQSDFLDSRIRGRWVKIRIEYRTKKSIFIKSVVTTYRQSFQ